MSYGKFELYIKKIKGLLDKAFLISGRQNCVDAYSKIAEALFQGGIDGFLLETMNYWDEALMALEGVELFFRKVKAAKNSNFCPLLVSI